MPLTGLQHQQVQNSLLTAFDEAGLRELVRFELDERLDLVAGGINLRERVYNLVEWANSQDRVVDLIDGAVHQNPTNLELIALKTSSLDWQLKRPAATEASPYRGLEFYDVNDAPLFFGRDTTTVELVDYLSDHHFLAIVGSSGSGKSSIVRAGVVATLRQGKQIKGSEQWGTYIVMPDVHPIKALAAALVDPGDSLLTQAALMDGMRQDSRSLDLYVARLAARNKVPRVVVVVDQFEELFTLCEDEDERKAFIDNLMVAVGQKGTLTVVLTLRSDFYTHCARYDSLRLALQDCQRYIGSMTEEDLRTAIQQPAAMGDWDLEVGLVDRMLKDVDGQPGALPLLSHALLETWNRRRGRMLTLAGYESAGGVQGAIAQTADRVYGELQPDQRVLMRIIFVRLTSLGESAQDTRRRVPMYELTGDLSLEDGQAEFIRKAPIDEAFMWLMSLGQRVQDRRLKAPVGSAHNKVHLAQVDTVLKRLTDARLIVAERSVTIGGNASQPVTYFEVAHEALIRQWPQLRIWLDEDRDGLRLHRRLTQATAEWERMNRDSGLLFQGFLLAQCAEWAKLHDDELIERERQFLKASYTQANVSRAKSWGLVIMGTLLTFAAAFSVGAGIILYHLAIGVQQLPSFVQGVVTSIVSDEQLVNASMASIEKILLEGARLEKEDLYPRAAVIGFHGGAIAAASRGRIIDVSNEISDTLRYAATMYVREGESILCDAFHIDRAHCEARLSSRHVLTDTPELVMGHALTGTSVILTGEILTGNIAGGHVLTDTSNDLIEPSYLVWAQNTAPQLRGWSSYTTTIQQQAVISATALFSQALALNPPPDTPLYVWISPGMFEMGSTGNECDKIGLAECPADEQPVHQVSLSGYWIKRTEVTNEQYKRCVAAEVCTAPANLYWDKDQFAQAPVTDINWQQANTYASWAGGRLPTEAEWEKACRGTGMGIYSWGDTPPSIEQSNYTFEVGDASRVGTHLPGANGLYDMTGNVSEWTADRYGHDYYSTSPDQNPTGPERGSTRAVRGAAWRNAIANSRCAYRGQSDPAVGSFNLGFRVVSLAH